MVAILAAPDRIPIVLLQLVDHDGQCHYSQNYEPVEKALEALALCLKNNFHSKPAAIVIVH